MGEKWIKISTDRERFKKSREHESRLVAFPDGISRHITLTKWHWEALDQLRLEYRITAEHIAIESYEAALKWSVVNGSAFEHELRDCFAQCICLGFFSDVEDQTAAANQNAI